MQGPTGVKTSTKAVREALKNPELKYFIRADIKSFYRFRQTSPRTMPLNLSII